MKRILLVITLLGIVGPLWAQEYLLEDFKTSIATVKKGGQPIQACFNYNCVTQTMEFREGTEVMKLTPIQHIDTLYLENHRMIPYGTHFLDVVSRTPKYAFLIDYKRTRVNKGKTGGMGIRTQGTVENVDFSSFGGRHTEEWKKGNEVWEYKEANTYIIVVKSKMKKFRTEKELLKLFPEKEDALKTFIKQQKIHLNDSAMVAQLVEFCMKD